MKKGMSLFCKREKMPTADTEPVRHGKVIKLPSDSAGTIYTCSECLCAVGSSDKFCRHCGAKLDESVDNEKIEMYLAFRKELDSMIVEDILRISDVKIIKDNGVAVGMMVLQDDGDYIDCLYILPKYRKKGIAEKFVRSYVEENRMPSRLHIVHNNKGAKCFWNKVFALEPITTNEIDTLYLIKGVYDTDD